MAFLFFFLSSLPMYLSGCAFTDLSFFFFSLSFSFSASTYANHHVWQRRLHFQSWSGLALATTVSPWKRSAVFANASVQSCNLSPNLRRSSRFIHLYVPLE